MAWITAIPIIGSLIEKTLEFAAHRWGVNPGDRKLKELTQEIISESNILETVRKFADLIIKYEGRASEVPKFILYLRCTWRPILQWGLTIKVMSGLFIGGKSIEEMKAEIIFVGGLALLREVGKKFQTKKED